MSDAQSIAPESDRGSERALQCLRSVLTADEKLQAWAIQRRAFALLHRRLIVGATSGRLLAISRPLIGGFDLTDVRWQDLREVHIHVGAVAARLQVSAFGSPDLASAPAQLRTLLFDGLRREQAQALYRICQANDQSWREKRRIRELEELRARAGGIQLGVLGGPGGIVSGGAVSGGSPGGGAAAGSQTGEAAAAAAIAQPAGEDAAARLRSARSMLDAGLISDAEYEALKARIINSV
ncbi:MAG TPA: SHOCT domain-containing protein [Steroidobacteraceae bacterium]|nr:SHOCT domain-containing protein [Steroidobacteraceae bacterium]